MVMRVTETQISRLIYRGTQSNLGTMARLQEQASTGKRINSYADDPQGVGLVRHYESLLAQNDQYRDNINRSRTFVESTDTALQDLLGVLTEVETIARRESSGASSSWQTRTVGATEVQSLIQQAMTILNQSVEGSSLFGGFRTEISPFITSNTGEVQYQGDVNRLETRIGPSTTLAINIPGSELLGSATSVQAGFGELSPRLSGTTALTEIANGEGWTMGAILFTDDTGVEQSVDLSGAGTIQDVIDILAGVGLNAAVDPGGTALQISDPDGGPLTIRDAEGGTTAASLGIVGSSQDGVVTGTDIRALPTWSTNLAAIDSLGAAMPLGSIRLTMNGTDVVVDLSGSATLGDVRTRFETAVTAAGLPALTMELSGAAINVVSATGESWRISNAVGDDTADAMGLSGEGSPAQLFGAMEDLVDALRAGDDDAIRSAIGDMESIRQNVIELEMEVAGQQTMLDWMDEQLVNRDYHLNQNLSQVRDADVVEVASQLTQAETAYQASLLVSSRMLQMSLFQYL